MVITGQLKARCASYTDSSAPVTSYMESLADIYWVNVSQGKKLRINGGDLHAV